MLSRLATLIDPLNLLGPCLLGARKAFSQTCKECKPKRDQALEEKERSLWAERRKKLQEIEKIEILNKIITIEKMTVWGF
jgi:Pao retrotransposon peptidase